MWGDSENCAAVIALHKMDKLTSKIFTTPKKLKISKIFMYRTFKPLMETGTVVDLPQQGLQCSIRTKRLIQTVAAHIQWNPVKKQSVVAWELNIPKMFMSDVLRSDQGLKVYQQSTSHFLTLRLKDHRAINSKCLFEHYTDIDQRISFPRWKYLQYWGGFQSANWPSSGLIISRNSWQGSRERPSSCFSHGFVGECHMMPPPSSISVKKGENLCWSLWEHRVGAYWEAF